jgi:regulator of nonsense transcripts 3
LKVEIDKKKGFGYIDFAEPDGLQKAIAASPVTVAQSQVVVLERKVNPGAEKTRGKGRSEQPAPNNGSNSNGNRGAKQGSDGGSGPGTPSSSRGPRGGRGSRNKGGSKSNGANASSNTPSGKTGGETK